MMVCLHPHALERLSERGATEEEVRAAVLGGESFLAEFDRTGFCRNFRFDSVWRDRHDSMNQVGLFAVGEGADWLVITVVTRFY